MSGNVCADFCSDPNRLSCPTGTTQIGYHNYDIYGCGLDGCDGRYNMGCPIYFPNTNDDILQSQFDKIKENNP